jgi:hypothetical protein
MASPVAYKPPFGYSNANAYSAALNTKQKLSFFEYAALYGAPFIYCKEYTQTAGAFVEDTEFIIPDGKILLITSIEHTHEAGNIAQSAFGWNTSNIVSSQRRVFSQIGGSNIIMTTGNIRIDRITYAIPFILKGSDKLWHQLVAAAGVSHTISIQGYFVDASILNAFI